MEREPAVYILASQKRGTLYVGVTSVPVGRMMQHRDELIEGFTKRYGVKRLVLIEHAETMDIAIAREKQLKNWHRAWKINLIEATNPTWRDLALDFGLAPLSPTRITR
ncbi:GIY-YIG nuclease family protein [Sphingomonas endolithica]|uniref:GIY-YIG nuclease family protein n=1 Tax=Sphingomonas endolithica TaxID=2972485 RepID=UPI0021AF92D9|nr:GIY-YIG nuclease family protein [Sphingomonas sp. ZFBP2030]